MTKKLAALFAVASGLAVGNLYWAQPLLAQITADFGMATSKGNLLISSTQIGYAIGILLIVPLGDILRRRRMIFTVMMAAAAALLGCALAPTFTMLRVSLMCMGILTVSGQIIIPLVGDIAPSESRGQLVGIVVSGMTTGILMSRFISGVVADMWGWRTIYFAAAGLNIIMALVIWKKVPDVPAKTKMPYFSLIKGVFTSFARYPVLPRILIMNGMVFGITFNLFWTALTFLLSGEPFGYSTFQIGLLSLVGLAGAAAGMGFGRLQDRGIGIPALGIFISASLFSMILAMFSGHSIVAIAVVGALFSAASQGVGILSQARLLLLSGKERSRLNTVFIVNNFVFCAIGSSIVSILWNTGGWPAVAGGAAGASLISLICWVLSVKTFRAMDE